MAAHFDFTKLSLTYSSLNLVEVMDVCLACRLGQLRKPLVSVTLSRVVENARLCRLEDYFNRP